MRRVVAARGARADLGVFKLAHRRGLLEVSDHAGVFKDVLAIKLVGEARQLVERRFPLGLEHAGEVALGVARIGAGQRIERSGDHQLEVALGQHFVGIFEVEHFALLGDAQLAVEGVDGLGEDGAMRGSAAAAHRAAAAVEEAQLDAGLARHHVQIAMSAENLPRGGQHAAIFVRVGVAEHDLLPVVPAGQELAVVGTAPKLAANGGRVAQVFNGFEERHGHEAGIEARGLRPRPQP